MKRLNKIVFPIVFALIPFAALANGFTQTNIWGDVLDAIRGQYYDPSFAFHPINPLGQIIPILLALIAVYTALPYAYLKLIGKTLLSDLLRKIIAILISMICATLFFGTEFYAGWGYLYFADIGLPPTYPPFTFPGMISLALLILITTTYRLTRPIPTTDTQSSSASAPDIAQGKNPPEASR